ncbi:MAG: hypothetical protein DCE86_05410 [Flavobacteriaceae bacterium]|nr:MAG: hypothetical protein DCE86_05410 [Flavobacteriaceae bacterium]
MANCFDELENENLDACINQEILAGVSEVGVKYAFHEQITTFPMPKNFGDAGYSYETAVAVTEDIVFQAGKGFGAITIQSDMGEVKVDLVGNKGNKKTKSSFEFYVPGNSKKLLGFLRTVKNIPMVFCVTERDGQKRLIGDKFNPAYLTEVAGTTGKGGEDDKGFQFTIESYCIPIVYSGALQLPVVTP